MSPSAVFAAAAWWALLTAAAHVAVVVFRVHGLHAFTKTTQWFGITAPVAYIIVFTILAVPLALLARIGWKRINREFIGGFFAAVALFSILILYRRVHPISWLLLAVGIGWQVSLWLRRHPAAPAAPVKWMPLLLAAVLGTLASGPYLMLPLREARALRRAGSSDSPNVLLLILDTVRAANLGIYGYHRPTSPVLDSLSAGGLVFERAFSSSSWSLPSHASVLTGVWGHETGGTYLRRVHDSLPTLAEVLARAGYVTGAFMANAGWAGHETGLARGYHRFTTYQHDVSQLLSSTTLTQTPLVSGILRGMVSRNLSTIIDAVSEFDLRPDFDNTPALRKAGDIADTFLGWHDTLGQTRPWFATLNIFDAHSPYVSPLSGRFNGGRAAIDRYDGAIAFVDSIVGRVLAELRARGDLDRTLVIVTSDHGEHFGENDRFTHGGGLYLPVVRVPLIVWYPPAVPAGRRGDPVSAADIPATILDVVGLPDSLLPGTSLRAPPPPGSDNPVLLVSTRRVNPPRGARDVTGDILGVITNEWHLIRYPDGAEELFRWREDSAETMNLVQTPQAQAVLPILRPLLTATSETRR